MSKAILVTGATGRQGSGVVSALLSSSQPYTILAVTRDPSSPAAQRLATLSPSIHLVRGDLSDVPSLWAAAVSALSPSSPSSQSSQSQPPPPEPRIWGVYSVQVSMGPNVTEDSEVSQGIALVDAAVANHASVFVYSSVDRGGDAASWETTTPVSHFRSKYRVEHHLRSAAPQGGPMAWCILRPVAFMDNLRPGFSTSVFLSALRNSLPADKNVQWVASADVGRFAALVFDSPPDWDGRAVGLAGDELSMDELAAVMDRVTDGRGPGAAHWLFGRALTLLVREMGVMIGWFASDGYKADVGVRRRECPELMDLEAYLRGSEEWRGVIGGR